MLGSFGNSPGNNGSEALYGRADRAADSKKKGQSFGQLLEREWSELPYAMMRLTAARRPWDTNRVYWRDRSVQLGGIELSLSKSVAENASPTYAAVYASVELRCEFTLQPSLADDQLGWSAPGISDVQLTTEQLAEKLLGKLVIFSTTGLSPASGSVASPEPSS